MEGLREEEIDRGRERRQGRQRTVIAMDSFPHVISGINTLAPEDCGME